jgi:hypothetical protein
MVAARGHGIPPRHPSSLVAFPFELGFIVYRQSSRSECGFAARSLSLAKVIWHVNPPCQHEHALNHASIHSRDIFLQECWTHTGNSIVWYQMAKIRWKMLRR